MNRRCRSASVLVALAVVVAAPNPVFAVVRTTKIIGGKWTQEMPSGDAQFFLWTSDRKPLGHWNTYERRRSGGPPVRINARGTQGFDASFDPGTSTVVYQQVRKGRSDLFSYDIATKTRTRLAGVDTPHWEWSPRVSNAYILFNRHVLRHGTPVTTVDLYDRAAGNTRVLRTYPISDDVYTGSVGERYASWTVCSRTCAVFIHDIRRDRTTIVPASNGRQQYSGVIDETAREVYLVRSGRRCGTHASIVRLPIGHLGADPDTIVDLPRGTEVTLQMSLVPATRRRGIDLLFARRSCSTNDADVYLARDVTATHGPG
jgi:hypothetical protein